MPYIKKTLVVSGACDAVHDKRLSISLAADGFSFVEISSRGELLAFGEAAGGHSASMTEATRDIKAFFAEVGVRPMDFRKMELVVDSDECVWVPDEVYTPASNRQYLKLVGGTGRQVMAVPCREIASTAVFAADEGLATSFKVALPGLTVVNQHVKMALCAPMSASHPVLIARWRGNKVDIAACGDGRYLYGNTIIPTDENTLSYQLVEIARLYGIERPDTELLMCGDVDRERFARFRPYFPKTSLFTGRCTVSGEFRQVHTYRHALLLV